MCRNDRMLLNTRIIVLYFKNVQDIPDILYRRHIFKIKYEINNNEAYCPTLWSNSSPVYSLHLIFHRINMVNKDINRIFFAEIAYNSVLGLAIFKIP